MFFALKSWLNSVRVDITHFTTSTQKKKN